MEEGVNSTRPTAGLTKHYRFVQNHYKYFMNIFQLLVNKMKCTSESTSDVDFCVLQFIVGQNGVCGLNYEHTTAEGPPIISIVDHVLDYWSVFLIWRKCVSLLHGPILITTTYICVKAYTMCIFSKEIQNTVYTTFWNCDIPLSIIENKPK